MSARQRKTFAFTSDDDDDRSDAELDEEHQEALIASLAESDFAKSTIYKRVFLSLILISLLFYLYEALTFAGSSSTTTARRRLLALLSASSLACSAFLLEFMPIQQEQNRLFRSKYDLTMNEEGPIQKYLLGLNAALSGVLLVAAGVNWEKGKGEEAWREALPMILFASMLFVRQQLAPVDLSELQRARYEYKGA